MKLLVTGATGRIGSRLIPRLLQQDNVVRILARNKEQAEPFRERGAKVAVGDLLQPETLKQAVTGVDAVIHLAAFFRGATPAQAQAVNYDGTLALAQEAKLANVSKFIYISTNLVYGAGRGHPAREEDEPQPPTERSYPVSKWAAEQALTDLYRGQGAALYILRLAFVYGEGDPHLGEALNLMRTWPSAKRVHMVHHADVAQAITLTLDKTETNEKLYNVADDEPVPISEIRRLNGAIDPNETNNITLDDPWEGIVDTSRIKNELGFHPVYPSLSIAIARNAL